MSIPTLPQELWARIVQELPSSSLSSVSQVNKTLHSICTTATLFRRHLPLATTSATPQQQFRRLRALSHPPFKHKSFKVSYSLRILCAVDDHLLLHDVAAARVVSFPTGAYVDVVDLVCNPPVTHEGLLMRSVVLSGNYIAFVSCIRQVRIAVWNFVTGDLLMKRIPGGLQAFSRRIAHNKFAVVAGQDREYVIYYTDENNIVVVDWRTGSLVSEHTSVSASESVSFVLGECASRDDMSVIGLVSQHVDGDMLQVICKCFDGTEKSFRVVSERHCSAVLRSLDKRTHVLLLETRFLVGQMFLSSRAGEFLAQQELGGVITTWNGHLSFYAFPKLCDNGRVIVAARGFPEFLHDLDYRDRDPLLCVVLADHGCIESIRLQKRDAWSSPVWLLRTAHEAFTVMAQQQAGVIELIKFVKEGGKHEEICVKSWSIKEKVVDATVVGDHFIVATCEHGRLFVWHFDKFCHNAKGVYACPGLIPKHFSGAAAGAGGELYVL